MKLKAFILLAFASLTCPAFSGFAFVHPGLLQNGEDLAHMKRAVAAKEEPVFGGFEVFRNDSHSQSNYVLRGPLETVARGRLTIGAVEYNSDANDGVASNVPQLALQIYPQHGDDMELPRWQVQLVSRENRAAALAGEMRGIGVPQPCVTHGRLTGACWLKLVRSGNTVTGFISQDGANWTEVANASVMLPRQLSARLYASSGMTDVTTRITFDHVSISAPTDLPQN